MSTSELFREPFISDAQISVTNRPIAAITSLQFTLLQIAVQPFNMLEFSLRCFKNVSTSILNRPLFLTCKWRKWRRSLLYFIGCFQFCDGRENFELARQATLRSHPRRFHQQTGNGLIISLTLFRSVSPMDYRFSKWIFYVLRSCYISHLISKCSVMQCIFHTSWFKYRNHKKGCRF